LIGIPEKAKNLVFRIIFHALSNGISSVKIKNLTYAGLGQSLVRPLLNEDALELYLLQSVEKHDDLDDMLHSCN